MAAPPFRPGLELARALYRDGVRPLLAAHHPGLPHAAGLVGAGSDVQGLDTPRSMDHDWGPRLTLFLREDDQRTLGEDLEALLLARLPETVAGFPTRYTRHPDGTSSLGGTEGADVHHRVAITTVPDFLQRHLGITSVAEIDTVTWLTVTEQRLLEVTGGEVFHDDDGEVTAVRDALAQYPDQVWRYRMAAAWNRISQAESFVGRCGELDDDLGSRVVALGLVRDQMRLALLQQRRYAPYAKWLGTVFGRLPGAAELSSPLARAAQASSWAERQDAIVSASEVLVDRQNALRVTPPSTGAGERSTRAPSR